MKRSIMGRQAKIINEYRRSDQFITHNFDYEWRGYSYGVQPDVDQYKVARHMTIAGVQSPSKIKPPADCRGAQMYCVMQGMTRTSQQVRRGVLEHPSQDDLTGTGIFENHNTSMPWRTRKRFRVR